MITKYVQYKISINNVLQDKILFKKMHVCLTSFNYINRILQKNKYRFQKDYEKKKEKKKICKKCKKNEMFSLIEKGTKKLLDIHSHLI